MKRLFAALILCIPASASAQQKDTAVFRVGEIELAAGGDNLTDEVIYDQCGLPQPGRTFRVQLRLR